MDPERDRNIEKYPLAAVTHWFIHKLLSKLSQSVRWFGFERLGLRNLRVLETFWLVFPRASNVSMGCLPSTRMIFDLAVRSMSYHGLQCVLDVVLEEAPGGDLPNKHDHSASRASVRSCASFVITLAGV